MNEYDRLDDVAARRHAKSFSEEQRHAFLAGFHAAAQESEAFQLLREWCEMRRDQALENYERTESMDAFAQRMAYISVLVKLSEMGCYAEDRDGR